MQAAGAMGMSEEQFSDCSPRFFFASHRGFIQHIEQQEQSAWERARYVAFYAVMPHAKKGRLRKLTDMGNFPWEGAPANVPQFKEKTDDEMADFIALAKQMHADHGANQTEPWPET